MTLPPAVAAALKPVTGDVHRVLAVGGGCIAHASRLEAERGTFFLKWGGPAVARTFAAEAAGLSMLRAARDRTGAALIVPDVVRLADAEPGFLLLEWLDPGAPTPAAWQRFGEALATLHRDAEDRVGYGAEQDNWIGATPQSKCRHDSWVDFFRDERLRPQIERARAGGRWRREWDGPTDRLLGRLSDLLPEHPHPSPLHGDLWSGNALALDGGVFALIDPAAYTGDRETDLALTELFGGFDDAFYSAYRAAWPLEPGYAERRDVYNLYHLLNHLNLFGAGYARRVEATLRRLSV